MQLPSIHLNGTGAEALLRQLEEAGSALRTALNAVADAAPNARDYYVQGDGAFEKAKKEHAARIDSLRHVLNEIVEIHAHIVDEETMLKIRTQKS